MAQNKIVKVRSGDTLGKLAKRHGKTVKEFKEVNNIEDVDEIEVGQELEIPGSAPPSDFSAAQYIPEFTRRPAQEDPLGPIGGGVPVPQQQPQQQRFNSPLDPSNPATYTPQFDPRVEPQAPTQGPLVGGTRSIPQGPARQGFEPATTQIDATRTSSDDFLDLARISPEVKGSDFRTNKTYKDYDYFKDDSGNLMFKSSPTAEPKRVTSKAALKEYSGYMNERITDQIVEDVPAEIKEVLKPAEVEKMVEGEMTPLKEDRSRKGPVTEAQQKEATEAESRSNIGALRLPAAVRGYPRYMAHVAAVGHGIQDENSARPITEKFITRKEKMTYRDVIARNLLGGKGGSLDYRDYSDDELINQAVSSDAALQEIKSRGMKEILKSTELSISQFTGNVQAYRNEKGEVIISDDYDFNPSQNKAGLKEGATVSEMKDIWDNSGYIQSQKGKKGGKWNKLHAFGEQVKTTIPLELNIGKGKRFLTEEQIAALPLLPADGMHHKQNQNRVAQEQQQQQLAQNLPQQKFGGFLAGDSTPLGRNQQLPTQGLPAFADGGQIRIKPENRGKFTASANRAGQGVQAHARSVLANPNATGLQKKRANFARNAAKWKKEDGGQLPTEYQTLSTTKKRSFSEDAAAMGHTIAEHAAHTFQDGGDLSAGLSPGIIQREPNLLNQYVPDFGCGGKLARHENGGEINQYSEGEGPGVNPLGLPKHYVGAIITGIIAVAGAVSKGVQKSRAKKEALALQQQEAADLNRANEITSLELSTEQGIQNRGSTFGFQDGGELGNGLIGSGNPQIIEYSDKADSHAEGSLGGIPVDALGNPSVVSKQSAVGLTEKGEVAWNGYVFSDNITV